MIDRYGSRTIFKNDDEMYENIAKERNLKFINQYGTPSFSSITNEQRKNLTIVEHVWAVGDKYYKLADTHYGDSKDWWIIAKFNNKPTESHIKVGDVILIPKPLALVLDLMRG